MSTDDMSTRWSISRRLAWELTHSDSVSARRDLEVSLRGAAERWQRDEFTAEDVIEERKREYESRW